MKVVNKEFTGISSVVWGIIAVLLYCSSAWADGPVASNVDFLRGIVTQEMRGTLGQLDSNQIQRLTMDTLRLVSLKPTANDWLLEYTVTDMLAKKNVQIAKGVTVPAPASAPAETTKVDTTAAGKTSDSVAAPMAAVETVQAAPGVPAIGGTPAGKTFRLEYRITDAYVWYRKIWRTGLVGAKQIERQGRMDAYLALVNAATGAIVWQGELHAIGTEVVPYSNKPFIESASHNVLKTDTIRPYWKDLTEVVLAGGSVGYVLYLFFSKSFN